MSIEPQVNLLNLKMRFALKSLVLLSWLTFGLGSGTLAHNHNTLPCARPANLLRDLSGKPIAYTPDEMKKLVRKADLSPAPNLHMTGSPAALVIVNEQGRVECVDAITGNPLAKKIISERLQDWVFTTLEKDGRPVSYYGVLVFYVRYGMLSLNSQTETPEVEQQHPRSRAATPAGSALVVKTEPAAIVWLDEIRRGVTDQSGKLELTKILPGRHVLRVRANGFNEATTVLLPGKRGLVPVRLTRTQDDAVLTFQQAEDARDKAKDEDARKGAVELYRKALQLRPASRSACRPGTRAFGHE